ncbi:V-type ATP synthase subunit D [Novipirellula artificiosorum]|uniref:V-type ATP synthase subunit D n=1 Tax=Novipirellula artificiosorum TaxID=2528016 RepID=A0A5C6DC07_9BACT|nr:V-type ATP synthase subunit D [Novipirellula artificiosorum]TWU32459.1 V-type ATP synthase subunit D [Novipirellula artificiosorum]
MMTLALNKTTLKRQRDQAKLYKRFLPSLELKRQQLQAAWRHSQSELATIEAEIQRLSVELQTLYPLMGGSTIDISNISDWVRVAALDIQTENVVGTSVPIVCEIQLEVDNYSRMVMPFWVDSLVEGLKRMIDLRVRLKIAVQRTELLGAALRKVTQRVNLFEKVLIPRAEESIRRIVIFLSDQERAAIVRAKIAKAR